MALEVERQLEALRRPAAAFTKSLGGDGDGEQPQLRVISQATGEDAPTFLERFRQAARNDICHEGGIVYQQWSKWRDVDPKTAVRTISGVLMAMGLTGGPLTAVTVAVATYLLYLGVDAFCHGE
ncbi:MAG: hypothetical protein HQL41_12635 [Alphaproteobacteria bacterium]|nr:hypothetical protein [Alphaproteobacteria bacterium]